jgi:hypothetical protein
VAGVAALSAGAAQWQQEGSTGRDCAEVERAASTATGGCLSTATHTPTFLLMPRGPRSPARRERGGGRSGDDNNPRSSRFQNQR